MSVFLCCHEDSWLKQIKEREYENPNDVDKVPVEPRIFHAVSRVFSHSGTQRNNRENGDAAEHVKSVEAGNYEERCRKLRNTPRIVRQGSAFANEVRPFVRLAAEKDKPSN